MQARDYCHGLAERIDSRIRPDERIVCAFYGETTDFVRLQHGLIRQAGKLRQIEITLHLSVGQRHVKASTNLRGEEAADCVQITELIDKLRSRLAAVEPDPYFRSEWPENAPDIRMIPVLD